MTSVDESGAMRQQNICDKRLIDKTSEDKVTSDKSSKYYF